MALMQQIPYVAGVIPEWSFGDRLRKAREQMRHEDGTRVTIGQFADMVQVSKSALGSWEADSHRPTSFATVRRIAEVSGVDLDWLVGDAYDERGRRSVTERYLTPPLDAFADEAVFTPRPDHAIVHWLPAPPIAA